MSCEYTINPSDVSGLLHWYRSDHGVGLSGSNVVNWTPVYGSVIGEQVSASHRPILVNNAVNGKPKIVFSSGSTQNQTSGLSSLEFQLDVPQPWTVVMFWQLFSPAIGVFDGSGDDGKARIFSTYDVSQPSEYAQTEFSAHGPGEHVVGTSLDCGVLLENHQTINVGISYDAFGTTVVTGNETSSSVVNDNKTVIVGNAGTESLKRFYLGARAIDYRGGARIDVTELMIFTGSLSTTQISDITRYGTLRYTSD